MKYNPVQTNREASLCEVTHFLNFDIIDFECIPELFAEEQELYQL